MSVGEVWSFFRRRWWIVALVTLVAAGVAFGYSCTQPRIYRAYAEAVVLPNRADYGLSMFLEARMRTFRAVLYALPKHDPELPDDLGNRLHVQLAPEEGRIAVQVDAPDPQQAARFADRLLEGLQEWVDSHAPSVGTSRLYVELLSPAEGSGAPVSPRYKVNTLAGAILGFVLGVPLAFLWEQLDDRLGDARRDSERLGLPVWPAVPVLGPDVPWNEEAESAWQGLYARLRFARAPDASGDWRLLGALPASTGALPGSFLAGLGRAAAQGGTTALLLDADPAPPGVHEAFGAPGSPGLSELLAQGQALSLKPVDVGPAGLCLLPWGRDLPASQRSTLLRRLGNALPALARAAESGFVRLPSPSAEPAALFVASRADALLLVAQAGSTRVRDVRRTLEGLGPLRDRVLGIALWSKGDVR
ncbi:MAG: Wzz/FepE/Etk N-terminal domain-containing protein [Chloroflexia bacterium]